MRLSDTERLAALTEVWEGFRKRDRDEAEKWLKTTPSLSAAERAILSDHTEEK
jgi:hypothetical protein